MNGFMQQVMQAYAVCVHGFSAIGAKFSFTFMTTVFADHKYYFFSKVY